MDFPHFHPCQAEIIETYWPVNENVEMINGKTSGNNRNILECK